MDKPATLFLILFIDVLTFPFLSPMDLVQESGVTRWIKNDGSVKQTSLSLSGMSEPTGIPVFSWATFCKSLACFFCVSDVLHILR